MNVFKKGKKYRELRLRYNKTLMDVVSVIGGSTGRLEAYELGITPIPTYVEEMLDEYFEELGE